MGGFQRDLKDAPAAALGAADIKAAPERSGMRPDRVDEVFGSGMKAAMLAHDLIAVGSAKIIVAGGMESVTNAP